MSKCIMPECPYCPSCPYGYIYQNEDWEEDRTEWICTYNGEERMMTDKKTEFTLDELKTMRIHMGAIKEKLCNQGRWPEALEYQIIQDKLELIIKEVEKGKKNE